jgi:hypothetical protein
MLEMARLRANISADTAHKIKAALPDGGAAFKSSRD